MRGRGEVGQVKEREGGESMCFVPASREGEVEERRRPEDKTSGQIEVPVLWVVQP